MNSQIARGSWQQLKGAVTARWGELAGDRLRIASGRHLQCVGRLDAACGRALDQLGRELDGVHRRSRQHHARTGFQRGARDFMGS